MKMGNDFDSFVDLSKLFQKQTSLITKHNGVVALIVCRGLKARHKFMSPHIQMVHGTVQVNQEGLWIALHQPFSEVHNDAILLLHQINDRGCEGPCSNGLKLGGCCLRVVWANARISRPVLLYCDWCFGSEDCINPSYFTSNLRCNQSPIWHDDTSSHCPTH